MSSKRRRDPKTCEHDYAEATTHEKTGDSVLSCCKCGYILAPTPPSVPQHWFDHEPTISDDSVKLSIDVLHGKPVQNDEDERLIQICGVCGHWLTAVHSGFLSYFDGVEDIADSGSSFIDFLREALCPVCNSACFRNGSVVARLSAAKDMSEGDVIRYVSNRADELLWDNGPGESEMGVSFAWQLESQLRDHGWLPRCPACGYAESYGDREFDFHHWEYKDQNGCCLCRKCHSHIHNEMRAKEQTRSTGREWQYNAVKRLFDLKDRYKLSFETRGKFMKRYNIPSGGVPESAVDEVFDDE